MLYRLTWSVLIRNRHGYLQSVLEVLMFKIFLFEVFLVDPSRFFVIASCLFASSCKSVKYWWILTIIHVLSICMSFAIHSAVYTNTSLSQLEQTCRKSVYGMVFEILRLNIEPCLMHTNNEKVYVNMVSCGHLDSQRD
jgi:hypothetical protein